MSGPSTLRRYAGLTGAAIGVITAGAAAGILAERKLVSRTREQSEHPFGSVRGARRTVVAEDGLEIYTEVDEPQLSAAGGGGRRISGRVDTLVFVHGYALNLDSWHFQRLAMRESRYRLVFYDQRSHGRSGRSTSANSTIDQLGRDLASVLDQVTPGERVVLIGHSMGGMSIMALAQQHPEWFGERIAGVALISTSAAQINAETVGLPGLPGRVVQRLMPSVVATLARAPKLVESGRRASSDIGFVLTRRLAFGGNVSEALVDFTDEMLASTPFDVVAEFFPGFDLHNKQAALPALAAVATCVLCGSKDSITPVSLSKQITELLPSAELVEVPGGGHMLMLERPDEVNAALADLVARAEARRE